MKYAEASRTRGNAGLAKSANTSILTSQLIDKSTSLPPRPEHLGESLSSASIAAKHTMFANVRHPALTVELRVMVKNNVLRSTIIKTLSTLPQVIKATLAARPSLVWILFPLLNPRMAPPSLLLALITSAFPIFLLLPGPPVVLTLPTIYFPSRRIPIFFLLIVRLSLTRVSTNSLTVALLIST